MGKIMSTAHREVILAPGRLLEYGGVALLRAGVYNLLGAQCQALLRHEAQGCVYGWVGHGLAYVGYASCARQHRAGRSGVFQRWLEHGMLRERRSLSDAQTLRYRIARKLPPHKTGFLILR